MQILANSFSQYSFDLICLYLKQLSIHIQPMKTLVLLCALLLSGGNVYAEIVPPRKSCEGSQIQLRICADKNLIASAIFLSVSW